ncbi:hypothetical protein RJ640_000919 [Escallonia rubra]|uniref:Retrovirus-related Pol polyprotein from transposon TNT 1-94 n=1 Tax=Escallonia rubra TaxID=112253 RepID=A0AA88R9P4_9ASTE|nr:hypothetical protein RJ640_000919 [Escallonia rubra]
MLRCTLLILKSSFRALLRHMDTLKYSGSSGVREHILQMNDMASQLKGLDMEISEGFFVHFIMTSLPAQFSPFKISYNTQKEKWKMSKLISMCVQEEERLKSEQPDGVHGFLYVEKLNKGDRNVLVGNGEKAQVEAVGTLRLVLENDFNLNLVETVYFPSIEIHRDKSRGILRLSQIAYIDKNQMEQDEMEYIPYASAVGSLMYAQVCTHPDIAYVVGMLGRYQINPGICHWKAAKKVMRYLQSTKDFMLTYRKSDNLKVIGYSDSNYTGCVDTLKSISGYVFMLTEGPIS